MRVRGRCWRRVAGGVVFTAGNMLLVAAISVAGMAVAFPVGSGLGLVIGAVLNYLVSPSGNAKLIFAGIALVCVAIALDAMAYGAHRGGCFVRQGTWCLPLPRGIVLSVFGGIGAGLFLSAGGEVAGRAGAPGAVHGELCVWGGSGSFCGADCLPVYAVSGDGREAWIWGTSFAGSCRCIFGACWAG